jgi:hypothetical protein
MKKPPPTDPAAEAKRRKLIEEFLQRTRGEVQQMLASLPQLEAGDAAAWQEVRFFAQRIVVTSEQLKLGIMRGCASDLEKIAQDRFSGKPLTAFVVQCLLSGIDMLSMEVDRLASDHASN